MIVVIVLVAITAIFGAVQLGNRMNNVASQYSNVKELTSVLQAQLDK